VSWLWKGALLGIANVLVIAIGIGAIEASTEASRYANDGVTKLVFMFGSVPGISAGVVLGGVARALERSSRLVRIVVLTLPALGLVYALAREFDMMHVAAVSCIPTVIAALILERWTRSPADPPPVPVARAVS
jgi:hypothetical protein